MSWWTNFRNATLTPWKSGTLRKVAPYVGAAVGAYFGAPYLMSAFGGGAGATAAGAAGSATAEELAGAGLGFGGGSASTGAGTALGVSAAGESIPWLQRYGGLIGSGIGGLGTYMGQQSANAANQEMARQQMQFQQMMSSTAYQRSTADMMAAGLNPMLGYSQGGASTPGGASAQMQNALGPAVSSALESARTLVALDQTQAQTRNIDASTADTLARIPGTGGESKSKQVAGKFAENMLTEQLLATRGGAMSAMSRGQHDVETREARIRASLASLERERAEESSVGGMYNTDLGALTPWLKPIYSLLSSGAHARRLLGGY